MNLDTVTIDRTEAREAYANYARAAKRERDEQARREMEQISAAYKAAMKEGVDLIALTPTIKRGGSTIKVREGGWKAGNYLLPSIAVCRASARFCFTLGVDQRGGIRFSDRLRFAPSYRAGIVDLDTAFDIPSDFKGEQLGSYTSESWSAQVPIVPPEHRPARGINNLFVLWEVDEWVWKRDPAPSRDPALLRHVGGDVYAVLAQWDLTDLERLVLSGRTIDS